MRVVFYVGRLMDRRNCISYADSEIKKEGLAGAPNLLGSVLQIHCRHDNQHCHFIKR